MKLLVVLALISVCSANLIWPDPPKSNLDVVKEAFWDYVAKATQTAEDSLQQIRQSDLGQDLNSKISQSTDTVNQYFASLQAQAAPVTQDVISRITQEAEQLKIRLDKDLSAVSDKLQPQAEELVAQLHSRVEELKREVSPLAEAMNPEALKAVLLQKSQELKGQLEKGLNQLQVQATPYTQEMREKMEQSLEDFQKNMVPLTQTFEIQLNQKAQEIQQRLLQSGEELRARLDSGAQDLQTQLTALWESFTQKTQ
uniref:Apolipoprotein A-IV n=1 Tax=Oryzias latipes TaxID=8090 RepID=A0A3P9L1D3_ORYLA